MKDLRQVGAEAKPSATPGLRRAAAKFPIRFVSTVEIPEDRFHRQKRRGVFVEFPSRDVGGSRLPRLAQGLGGALARGDAVAQGAEGGEVGAGFEQLAVPQTTWLAVPTTVQGNDGKASR